MNINEFKQTITSLFGNEMLEEFHDDYGFTHKASRPIYKAGYSTNLSLEVIEKAALKKADLIITHHDAWDFIYGLREECVKRLKDYGISHFWIHGPLDYADFGTCTSLMTRLGADSILKYSSYENGDDPGVAEFKDPVSFQALTERMRSALNEPVRAWKHHDRPVKRIGVLTGAGHSTDYIKFALDEGCDTYITGEATLYTVQYVQFAGINLLAGSHTFTEVFGVESLARRVRQLHPEIEIFELEEEHFELALTL
ncbi:Nif3-like dinuclear metal center hexameric protein [Peribacillus sp. SCS-26]|uniref:Nif3-like dinuclear metal center hexameric protein n=1 Tax=Paraperibacillus marinus TaxID=3115295 RepID=UPI003905B8D0